MLIMLNFGLSLLIRMVFDLKIRVSITKLYKQVALKKKDKVLEEGDLLGESLICLSFGYLRELLWPIMGPTRGIFDLYFP